MEVPVLSGLFKLKLKVLYHIRPYASTPLSSALPPRLFPSVDECLASMCAFGLCLLFFDKTGPPDGH